MAQSRKTSQKPAVMAKAAARPRKSVATSTKVTRTSGAAVRPTRSTRGRLPNLRLSNLAAAALLALQAGAIGVLANVDKATHGLTANFLAVDDLQSKVAGRRVYAPATHHMFDLNLAYVVSGALLIAALGHLLFATVLRRRYEGAIDRRVNIGRWIMFAVTGGLLLASVAIVDGVRDTASLMMFLALIVLTAALAYVMELLYGIVRLPRRATVVLALAAAVVPWLVLAMYIKDSIVFGEGLSAWMYWLNGSAFVLSVLLVVLFYLVRRQKGRLADYAVAERAYIVLGTVAASVLAWQLFAGALR